MFATISALVMGLGKWLVSSGFDSLVKIKQQQIAAQGDEKKLASDLAAREIALDQRRAELDSDYRARIIGRWYEPMNLMGYILVIFIGKVVIWDKVLGDLTHGNTDPITGAVGEWMGAILMFYVGGNIARRGVTDVARIIAAAWRR